MWHSVQLVIAYPQKKYEDETAYAPRITQNQIFSVSINEFNISFLSFKTSINLTSLWELQALVSNHLDCLLISTECLWVFSTGGVLPACSFPIKRWPQANADSRSHDLFNNPIPICLRMEQPSTQLAWDARAQQSQVRPASKWKLGKYEESPDTVHFQHFYTDVEQGTENWKTTQEFSRYFSLKHIQDTGFI